MSQETSPGSLLQEQRIIPSESETKADFITIGEMIAQRLLDGDQLLLDVDGVLVESDSLDKITPTSLYLLDQVRGLENMGYRVGLATARASHCIEYFRQEHKLDLVGTSILEEGQHRIVNGKSEYLSQDSVREFMRDAHYYMQLMPEFRGSWEEVRGSYQRENEFSFCSGNFQWQGDVRRSFWFFSNYDKETDDEILMKYFDPILESIAKERNLRYNRDLDVSVSHMKGNNLGRITMKGKLNDEPINKATALKGLGGNYVFVADGFGDLALSHEIKKRNGMVVGVKGNLDDSNEPCMFLKSADGVVSSPQELSAALAITRLHLSRE